MRKLLLLLVLLPFLLCCSSGSDKGYPVPPPPPPPLPDYCNYLTLADLAGDYMLEGFYIWHKDDPMGGIDQDDVSTWDGEMSIRQDGIILQVIMINGVWMSAGGQILEIDDFGPCTDEQWDMKVRDVPSGHIYWVHIEYYKQSGLFRTHMEPGDIPGFPDWGEIDTWRKIREEHAALSSVDLEEIAPDMRGKILGGLAGELWNYLP